MLFNSYVFLFLFLPALLGAVWFARRAGRASAIAVLVVGSLVFYGYFVPGYILLLMGSACFNYVISQMIVRDAGNRRFVALGVAGNLALLAFFKYMDFLIGTVNGALSTDWPLMHIVLPLAISFFTFQQIAYLVDVHKGEATPPPFSEYVLFVCFFPQLIAGPIVHHKEVIPQFSEPRFARIGFATTYVGLVWFGIGLAKKTLLADQMAPIADEIFALAQTGQALTFFEAWFGTLAFSFQIYFDFSGYSDMAIGLAIMFGVMLPINFAAPYKATSIIEFWRRWHMTLSAFLRDYLYIALGGNRLGVARRYVNLMATMLLGGLWHGAAWTFVVWGALHGIYLTVNHAWRSAGLRLPGVIGWMLTMVAVCTAWTVFRATDFASAVIMVEGMAGLNGVTLAAEHKALLGPASSIMTAFSVEFVGLPAIRLTYFPLFLAMIVLVVAMPTTQRLMGFDATTQTVSALPRTWVAIAAGLLTAAAIVGIGQTSQFIYFQF